jgi:hypothetical protein
MTMVPPSMRICGIESSKGSYLSNRVSARGPSRLAIIETPLSLAIVSQSVRIARKCTPSTSGSSPNGCETQAAPQASSRAASTTLAKKRRGRITGGLTSQLSGARLRRFNRSYFIPIHRFPPMLNEDDDACPLQRKLGPSRPVARFASMVCHGQYLHDRIRLAINDRIRKSA